MDGILSFLSYRNAEWSVYKHAINCHLFHPSLQDQAQPYLIPNKNTAAPTLSLKIDPALVVPSFLMRPDLDLSFSSYLVL
jgi:hypothetical protein